MKAFELHGPTRLRDLLLVREHRRVRRDGWRGRVEANDQRGALLTGRLLDRDVEIEDQMKRVPAAAPTFLPVR